MKSSSPRVIVSISRGIPTVYSTDPKLDVEIVDSDTDDLNEHETAIARQNKLDAEVKQGTLFEVA